MFTSKAAMFLYSVSPVHMGAGTALGAIDNPIQRERHTEHPMLAGSGLKGALRHEAVRRRWDRDKLFAVFGPDPKAEEDAKYAGALSVSDAQIVLFPVRSLRSSYVYATSLPALMRLGRLLAIARTPLEAIERIGQPGLDEALVVDGESLKTQSPQPKVVLETYAFEPRPDEALRKVGKWLAEHALTGDGTKYFQDKIGKHIVVLHEDRFNYFVRNATVVEPHVRIDDETGAASKGGLFYTENVPPEALFVSLVMASDDRNGGKHSSSEILSYLSNDLGARMVQVGGDATTGRGQMMLSFVREEVRS